ncbi:MAG TPA: S-adenosylmethionine decarboxylase [Blastocatellia bacterium]|nr:S-adenosylmethionine decarboxylase [Blastocatellia bacterium]
MNVGTEWLIDALGCSSDHLSDMRAMNGVCERIISDLDLHVIGQGVWHVFPPPGGMTGLYLLTESHLACHTYPETGVATFNLYCCRPRPVWPWEEMLTEMLGASRVWVRSAGRGRVGDVGDGASEALPPSSLNHTIAAGEVTER